MTVITVDFQGPYRSLSEAREALDSAQKHFDAVEYLTCAMNPNDWNMNICTAQKELYEVHEAIQAQFGEEIYKKIVKK